MCLEILVLTKCLLHRYLWKTPKPNNGYYTYGNTCHNPKYINIKSDVENPKTLPDEFVAPHLDARTCLGRGTDCL